MKEKSKKKNKIKRTPAQKKARFWYGMGIFCIIILSFMLIYGIFAVVNSNVAKSGIDYALKFNKVNYESQLKPEKDSDGYYTFVTDDDLKVMQLTDVHIGGGSFSIKNDRWALNAVAAMITAEKPDLVIVTGDIAFPVVYSSGSFNNYYPMEIFLNFMENLGVYWTFAFGNHDTEAYSYFNREELCETIESKNLKYCLFGRGPENIYGYGNNIIKVKNTSGIVTHALVTLDSNSYTDGDIFGALWKYDNIHGDQVDWYKSEIEKINAANKNVDPEVEPVKNSVFIHIPLREYRNAWKEYVDNGKKDTENVKYMYGKMGESSKKNSDGEMTYGVYCGSGDDELFEVGKTIGLKAVYCGHDHYNNFSVEYEGIRLTYGMSIDYLAYLNIWKEKGQRGCTIITIAGDGSFDVRAENYYQDKYKAQFSKQ